jgi:GH15 family glucan-1,4-alpha-glucosidase
MRTAALISSEDCSIDHLCWPDFDSPSIFIRLLDKDKGGHFEASPSNETTAKQSYSGNILVTKFLSEMGVSHVTDFMPLPDPKSKTSPFYPWLIRRLECVRGEVVFHVECFPAFDYARAHHTTRLVEDEYGKRVLFESEECGLSFELLWTVDETAEAPRPEIDFRTILCCDTNCRHCRAGTSRVTRSWCRCIYQDHGWSMC